MSDGQREMSDRNRVIGLLVFAFLLRVVFMLFANVNAPLTGDELAYQQIAEHVATGRGLYQTNNPFFPGQALYAWQAPLYPLALGALYRVFGANLLAAKLFGILVSTATVFVVYDLARRVFRAGAQNDAQTRRIALAAGLLVAIYPGLLTLAHLLLSETLFIFFLMLAFDLTARAFETRRAWAWIAAAGALWGLATLTRGITLYFTPLFALWIGWRLWRTAASQPVLRTALVPAILFLAAAFAVILPYTLRNYSQFQQFVLLETKGGVNLWLGNSPYTPNDFIRNVWKVGVREPMLNALPSGELERDRAAYALALDSIRAAPLTFFARMPIKFADFWGFERNLIDVAEATARGEGWNSLSKIGADLFAALVYMFVVLVGIAGLVYAPRDAWKILFGAFIFYFVAVHLIIFGDGRFHLPLIPILAMYAGWMLVMWRQAKRSRGRWGVVVALAALLILIWLREAWTALQVLWG